MKWYRLSYQGWSKFVNFSILSWKLDYFNVLVIKTYEEVTNYSSNSLWCRTNHCILNPSCSFFHDSSYVLVTRSLIRKTYIAYRSFVSPQNIIRRIINRRFFSIPILFDIISLIRLAICPRRTKFIETKRERCTRQRR